VPLATIHQQDSPPNFTPQVAPSQPVVVSTTNAQDSTVLVSEFQVPGAVADPEPVSEPEPVPVVPVPEEPELQREPTKRERDDIADERAQYLWNATGR